MPRWSCRKGLPRKILTGKATTGLRREPLKTPEEALKNVTAGDAAGHNLRESFEEAKPERINVPKDKYVAAGQGLKRVADEASLEGTCEIEEKLGEAAVQMDVTANEAAGCEVKNTAAPKDVAKNMPYRSDKQPEKNTKRSEGT